jgi:outer membrane protein assembly factor BamE (lipoprotein component of BamABCDE complex)
MEKTMKTIIAALALATLIAAPTFTQPAIAADEVIVGGKYIGQDQDANVRLQLRRDAGSEGF